MRDAMDGGGMAWILKLTTAMRVQLAVSVFMALLVIALQAAIAGVFVAQIDLSATESSFVVPTQSTCAAGGEPSATVNNARSIVVYLIIFIMALLFQVYVLFEANYEQSAVQVFMHAGFVTAMFAYSILQYVQIRDLLNPCTINVVFKADSTLDFASSECNAACQLFGRLGPIIIATIVFLALFSLFFIGMSYQYYVSVGAQLIAKVTASPDKQTMYRTFLIHVMLLKLDLFFFIAFAIQFVYLVLRSNDPEFALTIVAIVAATPIVVLAYYAVRVESLGMLVSWGSVLVCIAAYYLFKIIRIYQPDQAFKYVGSGRFLTLFASLGLVVTILSAFVTTQCMFNFGKGLKDIYAGTSKPKEREPVQLQ